MSLMLSHPMIQTLRIFPKGEPGAKSQNSSSSASSDVFRYRSSISMPLLMNSMGGIFFLDVVLQEILMPFHYFLVESLTLWVHAITP